MDSTIERLQRICADAPGVLSLAGGLPATELFPRKEIERAMGSAARKTKALQYGWPEGDERLREWIARRHRDAGVEVEASAVVVTSGAQQAIALAAAATLKKGDRVGVSAESYPAALELFRMRGAMPVVGARGVDAHYVMPTISNPCGTSLGESDRAAVLASNGPIFVDDAYAELGFDGTVTPPLALLAPDRVWQIGSFSKTICPGLRVGWLIPPPRFHAKVLRMKQGSDLETNRLGQAVLTELFEVLDYDAHLRLSRALYARRAEALADALAKELPAWRFAPPRGGFASEASDPLAMRLCHCNLDEARIAEAVGRLARAWSAFASLAR